MTAEWLLYLLAGLLVLAGLAVFLAGGRFTPGVLIGLYAACLLA